MQANGGKRVGDFNRGTRQSLQTLPVITGTVGQPNRGDLPQSGFLAGLWLLFSGTTTTAAASSTTAENYIQPPVGIARRIRVYNNQGVELWNTSGWGAYLYNATLRTGFDQLVEHADYLGGFVSPFTRYFAAATSLGASASENWRFALYLPIAWGPGLQAGLQLLQDPAIRYQIEITWGDTTDLYSATTGTVTLSNLQCLPVIEQYAVPAQAIDLPRLSYTKTVLEDLTPVTQGTGDFTYRFTTGNIATRIIQEFTNTAAGDRTPIPAANITQTQVRYSQTQVPYLQNSDIQLFRQRFLYDRDLPVGTYVQEFAMGPMGLPELVGTRDVLNTARLTDLDIITTLAGVTPVSAQCRTIREQLVANR